MKATAFLEMLGKSDGSTREMMVASALSANHLPSFLWNLAPVTVSTVVGKEAFTLTYKVMPDYLAVGEDDDYMHFPISPVTANPFMDDHGFSFPTKEMVDDIWQNADIRIAPVGWDTLYKNEKQKFNRGSTRCYQDHSERIQVITRHSGLPPTALRAGHKKDVVLTNRLLDPSNKGNVAIYGWFNPDGSPIQGLNTTSHVVSYVDYSHGLRMVSNKCVLNGENTTLQAIWSDPELCVLIGGIERLNFRRY